MTVLFYFLKLRVHAYVYEYDVCVMYAHVCAGAHRGHKKEEYGNLNEDYCTIHVIF